MAHDVNPALVEARELAALEMAGMTEACEKVYGSYKYGCIVDGVLKVRLPKEVADKVTEKDIKDFIRKILDRRQCSSTRAPAL